MFAQLASLLAVITLVYQMTGTDSYRVGVDATQTRINYNGSQVLTSRPDGAARRFVAEATYSRTDAVGKASVHARFVQEMGADGSFEDRTDDDPDFLTILNQPFAIQLDATTMRDLHRLRGAVPFEATSPLGGARLHGFLRPSAAGEVHGVPATGVRFTAEGPMTGALPDHPQALLNGVIHMDGTAYYAMRSAILVALDATLTIDGKLRDKDAALPVRIVYHRIIRSGSL